MSRQRLDPDALPLVLRQRITRKLLALLMTLWITLFVGAGAALVATGIGDRQFLTALAGVAMVLVSGSMWLYWALQLVPGSCRLLVTTGGFSARHCFITRKHGWDEVGRFYTRTYATARIPDYGGGGLHGRGGPRRSLRIVPRGAAFPRDRELGHPP